MLSFDPAHESVQNIYKLMVGAIVPRPIAFVSSLDAHGVHNLAPFSFFNGVSADPPVVLFCATVRREDMKRGLGAHKDTLLNVIATREFVVNVVTEAIAEKMNLTSAQVPPEVDEFELAGLTPVASELVKPPRVAESPVHMECRLRQIIQVSDRPQGGSIVLGDVVRFHVREELVDNFRIDADRLAAIGRMGGQTYTRTRDRFDLKRPE
ncbi:MAG TPA: flavin reductase family protein [Acidobacteriaceae bacterium]|jgi:flavin reductase (DIM6/NTAB) family NADH-FMN oxidoreductase RutF